MRKLSDRGPNLNAPPASSERGGSELRLRVLSGIVMAAVALVATWLGGSAFSAFWLAASVAVAFEWMTITGAEPRSALVALSGAGLAACVVAYRLGAGWLEVSAILGLVAAAVAALTWGRAALPWAICGLAYAAIVALVPTIARDRSDLGLLAILWMYAVVWTTDIAAYFAGRSLGGPKLWSAVSPKKTWSGFAGGLICAVAAGTVVAAIGASFGMKPPCSLLAVAGLSALASLASQSGDLAESALKRRFAVKDSGWILPGHGGAMDRLDGFVAVALFLGLALAGAQIVEALSGAPS